MTTTFEGTLSMQFAVDGSGLKVNGCGFEKRLEFDSAARSVVAPRSTDMCHSVEQSEFVEASRNEEEKED